MEGAVPTKQLDLEAFQADIQRVLKLKNGRGETVGWTLERAGRGQVRLVSQGHALLA